MLREFGPDLWIADGPTVRFMRWFPYPTRMAVVRLRSGGLWVWSPIALDDALADQVATLGPVQHLVAPNKLHHLFLDPWKQRFPVARLHLAPGLAGKRPDLAADGELGDAPDPAWADQIDQVVFRGSFALEEVVFFHRASRTALVCDLVQRFDPEQMTGVIGAVMRLWGLVGEGGSTPREWRASFVRREPARAAKRRLLSWEPERLVIAHGLCAETRAGEVIARGLHWLGD